MLSAVFVLLGVAGTSGPTLAEAATPLMVEASYRIYKAGESKAHLWLAKERYFLPIKIVFEDGNGSTLEQMLVSIQTR